MQMQMQIKNVLRIIILALIIIWMSTTFQFSNQNGDDSSNLSREVASIIVSEEEKIDVVEPYVRKLAHLSEYAVRWSFIIIFIFNLLHIRYKKNDKCFMHWYHLCFF